MKQHFARAGAVALAATVTLSLGLAVSPASAEELDEADTDYKILVVGKTLGFRHSHIDDTTIALKALGQTNGFTVDVWDPAQPTLTLPSTPFTSAQDLSQYATIVFDSPVDGTNNLDPNRARLLNDSEVAAFQGYIRGGGGYVGLHAATDTLHTVPWYSQLTGGGARFRNHPAQQQATMRVENPAHPSTVGVPLEWSRFDEWYNFTTNPRESVHVLVTLDESTYNPGSGRMGADHPLVWCQNFEGGRSWYSGAGHTDASWTDPVFLDHILGGIKWTVGLVSGGGDCVTYPEVDSILAGTAAQNPALAAEVAALLATAKASSTAGDHDGAIATLLQAEAKSEGLGNRTLFAKIGDLIEWQRALSDTGGPVGAGGIPVEVSLVQEPGSLTLTVADFGDGVQLTADDSLNDRWRFTGELPGVTVTDSRNAAQAAGGGWAASGQSSSFTSAAGTLTANHFGWVPRVLTPRAGVTAGAGSLTAIDGGTGLSASSPLASAAGEGRRGVTDLNAWLFLDAPIGTAEGEYAARVTVSLFPVD